MLMEPIFDGVNYISLGAELHDKWCIDLGTCISLKSLDETESMRGVGNTVQLIIVNPMGWSR